jgi:hypothetical protein
MPGAEIRWTNRTYCRTLEDAVGTRGLLCPRWGMTRGIERFQSLSLVKTSCTRRMNDFERA